jgi:N-acetylglutamate synthase-like GNAT family acetyltransferase
LGAAPIPKIREAAADDLPALHRLIESAYRGDSARSGWTHEADLLFDPRITPEELSAIIAGPSHAMLVAPSAAGLEGCVHVSDLGGGVAYLSLLAVSPARQAGALGKALIGAAETFAAWAFGAREMQLSAIDQRIELIAYYQRRGYVLTGEKRPFPVLVEPPLWLAVMEKAL